MPLWIIDEAQNLPPEFFRDFPSFLNFAFDARSLITVWLAGHRARALRAAHHARTQDRRLQPHAALRDRA
ncbi:AAA family ATPase [Burkholderia ubonensis]|uniref:AAA family ATPase n=1 Tax=Burkholderia ubonensis TaxID=101571 RepID=UPI002FC80A22